MTPEQFERVRQLFDFLVESPASERGAVLERECPNDPEVRTEVEQLLRQETGESPLGGLRRAVRSALDPPAPTTDEQVPRTSYEAPTAYPEAAGSAQGLVGRRVSHYRIEKRLGAGGMGEVYLAHDLALGRKAALKVLPPDFSASIRQRLLREAWANAHLQHPGIATFYEAGEADGVDFIAMEFVRGRTLRQRLAEGQIPVDEALETTAGVLEALVHAHFNGILHRDIKPENVMLAEDGTVKLLDLGLAKGMMNAQVPDAPATQPGGGAPGPDLSEEDTQFLPSGPALQSLHGLTQAGTIMGTLGYMPPEQLLGWAVDERADVFAVGALLYELLAGLPAFPGKTAGERMQAILQRDPDPIERADLSEDLRGVVVKALSREPADRFASASEFLRALRAARGATVRPRAPLRLAAVDFSNSSGDESLAWLSSALPDALGAALGRIEGMTLVPRQKLAAVSAAASSEGGAPSPHELGQRLGCSLVLDGSYESDDEQLTVRPQLFDVASGERIVEETLRGRREEVFEQFARVSAVVATSLGRTIAQADRGGPKTEAYECYARARPLVNRMDRARIGDAIELLERAVRIEPGYASALALLGQLKAYSYNFTYDQDSVEAAEEYTRRAVEADPAHSEAHAWRCYVLVSQNKMIDAYQHSKRAMELEPSNFFAPYLSAGTLMAITSREEALQLHEATEGGRSVGQPHVWRRKYTIKLLQRVIELNPVFGWAWAWLGWEQMELRNFEEGRWCLERAVKLEPKALPPMAGVAGYLGECLRQAGLPGEAREQFLAGLEALERTDHMYRDTWRGLFLCGLGRTALDEQDAEAARAAFTQAVLHIRGRTKARCGGHLLVQALAGLARAGGGEDSFDEAVRLFDTREEFDFRWLTGCSDDVDLWELTRAARELGREEADSLLVRALDAGSMDAIREAEPRA